MPRFKYPAVKPVNKLYYSPLNLVPPGCSVRNESLGFLTTLVHDRSWFLVGGDANTQRASMKLEEIWFTRWLPGGGVDNLNLTKIDNLPGRAMSAVDLREASLNEPLFLVYSTNYSSITYSKFLFQNSSFALIK